MSTKKDGEDSAGHRRFCLRQKDADVIEKIGDSHQGSPSRLIQVAVELLNAGLFPASTIPSSKVVLTEKTYYLLPRTIELIHKLSDRYGELRNGKYVYKNVRLFAAVAKLARQKLCRD